MINQIPESEKENAREIDCSAIPGLTPEYLAALVRVVPREFGKGEALNSRGKGEGSGS